MRHWPTLLTAVLVLAATWASAAAQLPGPAGPERGPFRKQPWLISSPQFNVWMRANVYQPRGRGPFPLVVISHGSSEVAEDRENYDLSIFDTIAAWWVRHGFAVVVPQRPGYGKTGGDFREAIHSCDFPTYREAAFAAAASIESTVLFMMAYPFVQKSAVILVGQSSGGLASLALAVRWPRMPKAAILFAAGNGGRHSGVANSNCAPGTLVSLVEEFGGKIHIPTLWLYATNDTYFGPDLSRRLVDGFRAGGGQAEYHLFPSISGDGHFFIQSPHAAAHWAPVVEKFIAVSR
jgi:dienelactone hydrolase